MLISRPPSRKRSVSHRAIARRAVLIVWAKRLLPAAALLLLTCIVLWPEFTRMTENGQLAMKRMSHAETQGGELVDAHYRGVDERNRPFTVTAETGRQASAEVIDLASPKADMSQENGGWVLLSARSGVYVQHASLLDLAGDVMLYRDDGTFLHTAAATLDLKTGFAVGNGVVSVEGPFGTIDATAFAVADKGTVIQFQGPARLVMNAKQR